MKNRELCILYFSVDGFKHVDDCREAALNSDIDSPEIELGWIDLLNDPQLFCELLKEYIGSHIIFIIDSFNEQTNQQIELIRSLLFLFIQSIVSLQDKTNISSLQEQSICTNQKNVVGFTFEFLQPLEARRVPHDLEILREQM